MTDEILPGLAIDARGQASVDKSMGNLLIDLAIHLEDAVPSPVDVEHVLAAMVLAVRAGEINAGTPLRTDNPELVGALRGKLAVVFDHYGDRLDSVD